jgi:hypothetical protein
VLTGNNKHHCPKNVTDRNQPVLFLGQKLAKLGEKPTSSEYEAIN